MKKTGDEQPSLLSFFHPSCFILQPCFFFLSRLRSTSAGDILAFRCAFFWRTAGNYRVGGVVLMWDSAHDVSPLMSR